MEQKITESQVEKVAQLSRLALTPAEITEFTGQLESILEYVAKLNELETDHVEPLAHCLPITNCLREDERRESMGAEKTLANAPQRDGPFFRVPKILGDNSGS